MERPTTTTKQKSKFSLWTILKLILKYGAIAVVIINAVNMAVEYAQDELSKMKALKPSNDGETSSD